MKKLLVVLFLFVPIVAHTTPEKSDVKKLNGGVEHMTPQESGVKSDGNQLLKQCTQSVRVLDGDTLDSGQDIESMYCIGYMKGFLDAHGFIGALSKIQLFCIPEGGIQTGQAIRIIVKWLKDHPERLHHEAGMLTLAALGRAFPCKNEAPSP